MDSQNPMGKEPTIPKVAVILRGYINEQKMEDADFAAQAKLDAGNFSRMLSGQLQITSRSLGKIVSCLSDEALQARVVAAHVFDYLPNDCRRFIEIRERVGLGSSEFVSPVDELEATLNLAREARFHPTVKTQITALGQVLEMIKRYESQRTPPNARSS